MNDAVEWNTLQHPTHPHAETLQPSKPCDHSLAQAGQANRLLLGVTWLPHSSQFIAAPASCCPMSQHEQPRRQVPNEAASLRAAGADLEGLATLLCSVCELLHCCSQLLSAFRLHNSLQGQQHIKPTEAAAEDGISYLLPAVTLLHVVCDSSPSDGCGTTAAWDLADTLMLVHAGTAAALVPCTGVHCLSGCPYCCAKPSENPPLRSMSTFQIYSCSFAQPANGTVFGITQWLRITGEVPLINAPS